MNGEPSPTVVVDTMVISWLLDERPNPLANHYRQLIGTAPVLLAFQTVAELRFGAIRAGWGDLRRRRLERSIAALTVVQSRCPLVSHDGLFTQTPGLLLITAADR